MRKLYVVQSDAIGGKFTTVSEPMSLAEAKEFLQLTATWIAQLSTYRMAEDLMSFETTGGVKIKYQIVEA